MAVVGLPLAAYDEIQREINAYYARKYGKEKGMLIAYTLPAINRGLQAAGRVIRAESERGVLLFCDRRFAGDGLGSVNQFLPQWVREEIIVVDAGRGRELIAAKIREWGMDRGHEGPGCREKSWPVAETTRKKSRPGKAEKRRDLKELVKTLGLDRAAPLSAEKKRSGELKSEWQEKR